MYMKKDKIVLLVGIYFFIFSYIHFFVREKPKVIAHSYSNVIAKTVTKTVAKTRKLNISKPREVEKNYSNVGLLSIENEDSFSSIVMQGEDNSYFLNHDQYGKENIFGIPFLDYRVNDSSKVLIIYGHNSKNVNLPFKTFENYYSKNYYDNHKYIDFVLKEEKRRYEIFSVFVETENWDYLDIDFPTQKSYYEHLYNLYKKSIYDTGYEVNDDEVLIIQTCSTKKQYQKFDKKFLLIISRRVL